jgi:hypothetical protein
MTMMSKKQCLTNRKTTGAICFDFSVFFLFPFHPVSLSGKASYLTEVVSPTWACVAYQAPVKQNNCAGCLGGPFPSLARPRRWSIMG